MTFMYGKYWTEQKKKGSENKNEENFHKSDDEWL